jgi:hypothetical protein
MFSAVQHKSAVAVIVTLTGIILAACGSTGTPVSAGSSSAGSMINTISVLGSGEAKGTPDIATIDLGINVTNSDIGAAVSSANETMAAIRSAVLQAGVAEKDIQTINFNVYPQDSYDPQTGLPTGTRTYQVNNTLRVVVHDITATGKVIDAGLNAGANSVQGVSFGISDTKALEAEARKLALADAMDRAQQLADGLSVRMGKAVIVSEVYGSTPPVMDGKIAAGYGGGGGVPTPVDAGQLTVTVQVSVTFAIVP